MIWGNIPKFLKDKNNLKKGRKILCFNLSIVATLKNKENEIKYLGRKCKQ